MIATRTTGRIPALDGLRGIAALLVVLQHTQPDANRAWPTGILGVDIFFALSGFLIGGILMDSRGRPDFFGHFYLRRTLRIWPLYEAVVLVVVMTNGIAPTQSDQPPWMLALFLGNWALVSAAHSRLAAGILWSLAVEEHFYLLLPPLIWISNPRRLLAILAAIVVGATGCRYYIAHHQGFMAAYVLTPCRIDALAWGVLAAWIVRSRPNWIPTISAAAILLWIPRLAMLSTNPSASTDAISVLLLQPFAAIATAALLVGLASGRLPAIARAFAWRPLTKVGTVSYGLYLLHPLVIEALESVPAYSTTFTLVRFVAVTAVTFTIASISWRFFESPILRLSEASRVATVAPSQA